MVAERDDVHTVSLRDCISLGRVFKSRSPTKREARSRLSSMDGSVLFPGERAPEPCLLKGGIEAEDDYEAFDAADDLEKGLADWNFGERRTAVASAGLARYTVFLDPNGEYLLVSQNIVPRYTARYIKEDKRVEFFNPSTDDQVAAPKSPSENPGRRRPAYVMTHSEDHDEWILYQTKCKCCMQRPRHLTCEYIGKGQQVARVQHSKRTVGGSKARVHYIEVHVPPVLNGGDSAVWCPLWTGKDLGSRSPTTSPTGSQSPRRRRTFSDFSLNDLLPTEEDEPLTFRTRLPTWDSEVESLVLNFEDRCNLVSSPRNFILSDRGPQDKTMLQHAQNDKTTWCLDFAHPLSEIQAFAIAMSSMEWQ